MKNVEKKQIIATLNNSAKCCTCTRQARINGTAWIYCPIYIYDMLELEGFDETGETQGCSEHEGVGPAPHEFEARQFDTE